MHIVIMSFKNNIFKNEIMIQKSWNIIIFCKYLLQLISFVIIKFPKITPKRTTTFKIENIFTVSKPNIKNSLFDIATYTIGKTGAFIAEIKQENIIDFFIFSFLKSFLTSFEFSFNEKDIFSPSSASLVCSNLSILIFNFL